MREKAAERRAYKRHVQAEIIAVVGNFEGDDPVLIGAVDEGTYQALLEEDRWEKRKDEWLADWPSSIDRESLRVVRLRAWLPDLWEVPEVGAEVEGEVPE